MEKTTEITDSRRLTNSILKGLLDKKGNNIIEMDLREIESAVCDYFVIASGGSNRQVNALANAVKDTVVEDLGEKPWHIEGMDNCSWVLLDYANVVVHVFQEETREFYKLEELWADATVKSIETID
ncbi:ribosome silencing factor [Salibacteraceae bacterium]|nr:ribosome silencing factor [Salibacteraceae bacterium]